MQNVQQTYGGQLRNVAASISAASPPIIAPIITTLPQAHLNVINSTLNMPINNKSYTDNIQRMNAHVSATTATVVSSSLHAHSSTTDITEMSSTVRNFSIIGQMFHS